MIPLQTRDAARAFDRHAIDVLGVSGTVLMENAGRGAFDVLRSRFGAALERVVIVGGPGQNGGDAWVVARHLLTIGCQPEVFIVGRPDRVEGDARENYDVLRQMGQPLQVFNGEQPLPLQLACDRGTLVVDGLFGTGLNRDVEGEFAVAVSVLNAAECPTVALDLPSGVNADTGGILGVAVDAELTVSFAAPKRGHYQHPGRGLCGEVVVAGIGVPAPQPQEGAGQVHLIEASDVARAVPVRASDAHKGSAGHLIVVGGSAGKTGACVLSGRAAIRMGAGLVTLVPRAEARGAIESKVVELMTAALPGGGDAAADALLELAASKTSAVVGPGLGVDADGRQLARRAAIELPIPCVLDADALSAFAGDAAALRDAAAPRVLTPHPGEAGRLLGVPTTEVQADRIGAAEELAARSGHVTVLKGAGTLVATPSAAMRLCDRGTAALAVAGTGDVLAGTIGALLRECPPAQAAWAGAYIHAVAGELSATADRGLLASEVADAIPRALAGLR